MSLAEPGASEPLSRRRLGEADEVSAATVRRLLAESAQAAQLRKYEEARRLRDLAEKERADRQSLRRAQEVRRQQRERGKLREAHSVCNTDHATAASTQAEDLRRTWSDRLEALRERHRTTLVEHEEQVRAREELDRKLHTIYSGHVRDMQQAESRLAAGARFEEARLVRRKIEEQERAEEQRMDSVRNGRVERSLERLRAKQGAEERFLKTQMKNAMSIAQRKADDTARRLCRNLANLEQDMMHAHRIEFVAKPGVGEYVQPHFIKLRPRKHPGPTAMGTQVLESVRGPHLASIPSLCEKYGSQLDTRHGPRSVNLSSFPHRGSDADNQQLAERPPVTASAAGL